jgi:hypothetical protein
LIDTSSNGSVISSSKTNISEHVFIEGELAEDSVVRNLRTTATYGKNYNTKLNSTHNIVGGFLYSICQRYLFPIADFEYIIEIAN